jgi:hypothetical protein
MKNDNTTETARTWGAETELFPAAEMAAPPPFARWMDMMQLEAHRYCVNGYRVFCREKWAEYWRFVRNKREPGKLWDTADFIAAGATAEIAAKKLALKLGFPLPEEVF